jgi:hypothetical protein
LPKGLFPNRERQLRPKTGATQSRGGVLSPANEVRLEIAPSTSSDLFSCTEDKRARRPLVLARGQRPLPQLHPTSHGVLRNCQVAVGASGPFVLDETCPLESCPTPAHPLQTGLPPAHERQSPFTRDLIEASILPRKLVEVCLEDTQGNSHKCRAVFDPESEVSFASRAMIQRLGKKSRPWKSRTYQTIIGVFSPLEYANLEAEAPHLGLDNLFPLTVAILEGICYFGDICFGRTAIRHMMKEHPDFKAKVAELCGSLCSSLELPSEPIAQGRPTCSQVLHILVGANPRPGDLLEDALSGSSLPLLQPRAFAPLGQPAKTPITPPISHCTASETQYAVQDANDPFGSLPTYTMNLDTSRVGRDGTRAYLAGLSQQPVIPVTVSPPHSSVNYEPMNLF